MNRDSFPVSFRMSQAAKNFLTDEARRRHISLNSLLNRIVHQFMSTGIVADRLRLTVVGQHLLSALASAIDEDQIMEIGKEFGKEHIDGMLAFHQLPFSFDGLLSLLRDTLGEQSNWFKIQIQQSDNSIQLTMWHEVCESWSRFIASFSSAGFQNLGFIQMQEPKIAHHYAIIFLKREERISPLDA